jgi:predicted nucleotidyltransferase
MTRKLQEILDEVRAGICSHLGESVGAIILFGSYAREDASGDSDIDIFVLINGDDARRYDAVLLDIAVDISIARDCVISIMSETRAAFDRMKRLKPLYRHIESEGRKIYAA